MSKLYKQLKASTVQTAVCPITGIVIKMDIPTIPNKAFIYDSPLSRVDNALGIANLTFKDKASLPKPILSGALLTLLNAYKLIDDKLSAVERNEVLSNCSTHLLHSFLHLFVSNSKARIYAFPRLSLAALLQNEVAAFAYKASVQESVKSYVEACTVRVPSPTTEDSVKTARTLKIKTTSSELRAEMKQLINSIHEDGLVNSKVLGILLLVSQKNNLYSLNPTIRFKLVEKLNSLDSIAASKLATIIKNAAHSSQEIDIEKHFDNAPKKSLADILAAKMGKVVEPIEDRQQEPTNLPSEEQKEEQAEEDSILSYGSESISSSEPSESKSFSIVDEIIEAAEELEEEELLGDPDEYSDEDEEGDDDEF